VKFLTLLISTLDEGRRRVNGFLALVPVTRKVGGPKCYIYVYILYIDTSFTQFLLYNSLF
jgi:hypothetical protein